MKITLNQIPGLPEPEIEIRYSDMSKKVDDLVQHIRSREVFISGEENGRGYRVKATSIYYIESVDRQVFIYTDKNVYRTSLRLYQLVEQLKGFDFIQISKSCVLNLDVLESIQTIKNSRLEAILTNGERLYVTRAYITAIKEALTPKEGDADEE